MFSPKVLDRANTIEFRVSTNDLPDDLHSITAPTALDAASSGEIAALTAVMADRDWHRHQSYPHTTQLATALKALHRLLSTSGFEFGHRVYFESYRFAVIHSALGGQQLNEALDLIVMQKLLPRLHGSRRHLSSTLGALAAYCFAGTASPTSDFDPLTPPAGATPALPTAFNKLQRMIRKLNANQFVSFTE